MNLLKFNHSYADISGIPNSMISDSSNQMPLQQHRQYDFNGRHPRIRLDYKKSFQDDLIFFPEPNDENTSMIDNNFLLEVQQHGDQYNSSQKANKLALLIAFKREQQQHQQFIQSQAVMRSEVNNCSFHQHQPLLQEQHLGEGYFSSQNVYNHMNLRTRG